jgi:hypothetical protein
LRSVLACKSGTTPEVGRNATQIHASPRAATILPRSVQTIQSVSDAPAIARPDSTARSSGLVTTRTASLVL